MSATPANIDSGLSGKPSDNIDKQTGPTTGSNVESPGSSLNPTTVPAQSGNASSDQGADDQKDSQGNADGNAQQQQQQQTSSDASQ